MIVLAQLIFSTAAFSATTGSTLGGDYSFGTGYNGFDLSGVARLDQKNKWDLTLDYTYAHSFSDPEAESKSQYFSPGFAHEANEHEKYTGGIAYWKDALNNAKYIGPKGDYTYLWLEGEELPKKRKHKPKYIKTREERESEVDREQEDLADQDESRPETFGLTIDAEIYVYSATLPQDKNGNAVKRGNAKAKGNATQSSNITQYHPSITLEKPLFNETTIPYLTLGIYKYRPDPKEYERGVGKQHYQVRKVGFGTISGFQSKSAELGITMAYFEGNSIKPAAAISQSATDDSWSHTYSIEVTQVFEEHFKPKISWSRTIQDAVANDTYTLGLTYLF